MSARARGFTLVEMIVLIVVVGVAAVGLMLAFRVAVQGSADPQVQKQALAAAEAMMDEILLNSFAPLPGTGSRANFDDVNDYAGYTTGAGGIVDLQGNAVAGLTAYNIQSVTVTPFNLNAIGAANAFLVSVTVTAPGGITVVLDGYRTNYAGP